MLKVQLTKIENLEKENFELHKHTAEFERRMSINLDLLSPASFLTPKPSWNEMTEIQNPASPLRSFSRTSTVCEETSRFDLKVKNNLRDLQKVQNDIVQLTETNTELKKQVASLQRNVGLLEEELDLSVKEKTILKTHNEQREKRLKNELEEAEFRINTMILDYKKQISELNLCLKNKENEDGLSKSSIPNQSKLLYSKSVIDQNTAEEKNRLLSTKLSLMEVF
jgi:hypothetical protein